jgi:signal transduction histidine kinase
MKQAARQASRFSWIAWTLWALMLVLVVAGLVLTYLDRATLNVHPPGGAPSGVVAGLYAILVLAGLSYGTVGALIASRHPRNPIGWLFLAMAIGFAGVVFSQEYGVHGLIVTPGSLPAVAWFAYPVDWLFATSASLVILALLLFPTGEALSSRWRWLVRVVVVAVVLGTLSGILRAHATTGNNARFSDLGLRSGIRNPLGVPALSPVIDVVNTLGSLIIIVAGFASLLCLFLRFRRARGDERQQLRWLAYTGAALLGTLVFVPLFAINTNLFGGLFWFSFTALLCIGIPVASGVAILRFRLYDLDLVVKKTVVLGALVALSTMAYLAIVVGIGAAIGRRGNTGLTFAGAAVVALLFQPVRVRARIIADRLVYGERATPYEVLSAFADRVGGTYSTEDVLPRMADILAAGTGAVSAKVFLRVGTQLRLVAARPAEGVGAVHSSLISDEELPAFPGSEMAFAVRHQGDLLGALTVIMPPSEPLTPSQERLIQDLATQAGLVLRNVRLIEELRASRQRLVKAQDEERRRLERNLHDGAQQQLVALAIKQRLAATLVTRDPDKALEMMGELESDAKDALENLRDLARGIYPQLLADQGLASALQSQARKASVSVTVVPDGIGRYLQEAEAAVYFCCLEALQNVAKYAAANHAEVRLWEEGGDLMFSVADDGRGYDSATTAAGSGTQNMADRLAALGGALDVRSSPGKGTTVTGRIPVENLHSAEAPDATRTSG